MSGGRRAGPGRERGPAVRLAAFLRPFAGPFAVSLVLTVVSAGFDVFSLVLVIPLLQALFGAGPVLGGAGASAVERLLDSVAGELIRAAGPLDTLRNVCVLILAAILLKNAAIVGSKYFAVRVREGVERDLREAVFGHLQRLPLAWYGRARTGQVLARVLADTKQAREVVSYALLDLFRKIATTVAYGAALVFLSWRLSLLALALAPLLAFGIAPLLRRLRHGFRRAFDEQGELLSVVQEAVSGIRLVKASGAEAHERERFRARSRRYERRMVRTGALSGLAAPLSETLSSVVAVLLVWLGARMVLVDATLQPEQFLAFVTIALQLISPVKAIADFPSRLQGSVAAAERLFEVLDEPAEPASGARRAAPPRDGIRLEGVEFAYEPGRPVLRDIDLEARPGRVVALVGPSGSGKSTLVDLLPRFIEPTAGRVLLDGTDLREFDLRSLRALFGIVSQETVIFHDTVRANIAYGDPVRSDDEVRAAARAAHALAFVEALPAGLDTPLGDRGVRLSGGQRQRIGIARAVLRDPPVLILDEATSSLDTESEQEIQRALAGLFRGRTVFVIAHRLSTVHGADEIVVLEEGRIVERGTHAGLHARGGAYRRLHDLQFAAPGVASDARPDRAAGATSGAAPGQAAGTGPGAAS
ncbi:MAG: ABC transporter ATP-binding protein [Gemmatimonadota bacterium]|nr:ABC transporter ATP-binding protein [Gemmatimonadota bacterium]